MAGRCGCGSATCSCLLSAGEGITITGTGSPANPYVISALADSITVLDTASVDLTLTGLGVLSADVQISADAGNIITIEPDGLYATAAGGCPEEMTIAELIALRDAAGLDVCASYVVTDWSMGPGTSLPGPNRLIAYATDVDQLSPDVLVETPIFSGPLNIGPDRGKYLWDATIMTELSDPLRNVITELGGVSMGDFPWGNFTWTDNILHGVTFTGGFAVTGAAAAAGVAFNSNRIVGGTLDFTGTVVGSVERNVMHYPSIQFGENTFVVQNLIGQGGSTVIITNTSTTGTLLIQSSELASGNYSMTDDAALAILASSFHGTVNVTATDVGQLYVNASDVFNATLSAAVTGSGANSQVLFSRVSGGVFFTGATTSLITRAVNDCSLTENSTINVSVSDTSPASSADRCVLEATCDLNVHADGNIVISRLSTGITLSTGAFSHLYVSGEGSFTQTLTANNTNTYRGFGANTLV